ncbi:MAG: hypothetical protein [Bacteriophage sp.]|nr:MAG: hypothetical protein [Bacteriophage sp.]
MNQNIDMKQHKSLVKLQAVLESNPFGSSMSQIMNDCRVSLKTAKNLLSIAEFVKKDGELYFLKDDLAKQHIESIVAKTEPKKIEPKQVAMKKDKPLAKVEMPKLANDLTFDEILKQKDTDRLKMVLCSGSKVQIALSDLIQNFPQPYDNVKQKKLTKFLVLEYMEVAQSIIDDTKTLAVNRRNALKKYFQLLVLSEVAQFIEIQKTTLVNISMDYLYPDLINRYISMWDFETPLNYNESTDRLMRDIRNQIFPYVLLSKAMIELDMPITDCSMQKISEIDDVDFRTVAILCSHFDIEADDMIAKTCKTAEHLINDAQLLISSAIISCHYRTQAIKNYFKLVAYEYGIKKPTGQKSEGDYKSMAYAYGSLVTKINEVVATFEQCVKNSGVFRNRPNDSEIYKSFQEQLLNFPTFIKDLVNIYHLNEKPKQDEVAMPVKQDVDVQKATLKDKLSSSVKMKQVKSLHLPIADVEELLKEIFDMDEVILTKKNNTVLGFDLKSEREI